VRGEGKVVAIVISQVAAAHPAAELPGLTVNFIIPEYNERLIQ